MANAIYSRSLVHTKDEPQTVEANPTQGPPTKAVAVSVCTPIRGDRNAEEMIDHERVTAERGIDTNMLFVPDCGWREGFGFLDCLGGSVLDWKV